MTELQKQFLIKRGFSKKSFDWDYSKQKQTKTEIPIETKGINAHFFRGNEWILYDPTPFDQKEAEEKIRKICKNIHPQELQNILPLSIL